MPGPVTTGQLPTGGLMLNVRDTVDYQQNRGIPTLRVDPGESAFTVASTGVLLDRRQYGYLFLRHLLSLFPALGLVIGLALVAKAVPCELPGRKHGKGDQWDEAAARCDEALHTGLTIGVILVGVVAWLAAWSLRSASWLVASYFAAFPDVGHREIDPVATSIVSIFLQTACNETIRLASLVVGYALFIAEATINTRVLQPGNWDEMQMSEQDDTMVEKHPFRLRARDPRFSVALWVGLGWAVAETIVGCVQILQQLSLYAPPIDASSARPSLAKTQPMLAKNVASSPDALKAPLWPAPAGSERASSIPPPRVRSPGKSAERSQSVGTRRAEGTGHASPPEDPSTQLAHARDELVKKTHKDIPHYGSTEDIMTSSGSGASLNAHKQAKTSPKMTVERALEGEHEAAPLLPYHHHHAPDGSHLPPGQQQYLHAAQQPHASGSGQFYSDEDEEDAESAEMNEADFEELVQARKRQELENTLGVPLPDVPVALCLLWRIDGVLFNLGASMIMAASLAYGQGRLDLWPSHHHLDHLRHSVPLLPKLHTYTTAVVIIFLIHAIISSVWNLSVPRFGFALVTYSSLLVALFLVIVGLAQWGALV